MRILSGETYADVKEDERGRFPANCSVCFQDKTCVGINYPSLIDICEQMGAESHGFAVCEDCIKNTEPHHLFKNLMDYFIMDELCRWLIWEKDGIIRSDLEFQTLLQVAREQGVLYREEKRTRHRVTKQEKTLGMGFLNMLKGSNTADYVPNPLMMGMFKKLYEG